MTITIRRKTDRPEPNTYTPKEMFDRATESRFYLDNAGSLVFAPKYYPTIDKQWGAVGVVDSGATFDSSIEEMPETGDWNGPYREVSVDIAYEEV